MDFWTRLLASAGVPAGKSRKDAAKDPAKRLHRFEKEYGQLLQIWRKSPNLATDDEAIENVELRLQQLTETLSDETRRPLPHPCIQYAALKQMYIPIAKIAYSSYHEWIVNETVLFFATLIESEEENFVENLDFSNSLTALLTRITRGGGSGPKLSAEAEERVVELAFNITTKLRLSPEILPAWFKGGGREQQQQQQQSPSQQPSQTAASLTGHARNASSVSQESTRRSSADAPTGSSFSRFTGRTQKQDFPLFYVLMEYIHHEGKIGDFARTGLLYIIEASSSSAALEQWIVESDLSTLMATGLGAQYSQLSRKLVVDYIPDNLPPVLAFSDYQHPSRTYEIESSCSEQFQAHLDAFLSHLLFWQDVLNHCKSNEIKSTLLEHFQVIFLQQLLYPSLLESSDIDGGSSVAVLTYLRRILESLDHPDMINLILHYLLDLPGPSSQVGAPGGDKEDEKEESETEDAENAENSDEDDNKISAARKRKSMDLATMLAQAKTDISSGPLLFNLVDLILACLRSHSQQTILVTLQLISTIIKRHHRYAVITLLRTESTPGEGGRRTMGAHSQEVEYLMSLAGVIGGDDNFEEIYESVVKDTTTKVEGHLCSLKLVSPNATTSNHGLPTITDSLPGAPREVRSHTLRPDDPLLNAALEHLETFLLNPVDVNLSLTETLTDLASCGFMSLEGWLLRHPHKYTFDDVLEASASPRPDFSNDDYEDEDSTAESLASCLPPEPDSPSFAEYQRKRQLVACRRRPKWTFLPRMLDILDNLCKQVATYRETIPRFNELLQQRREAFQMADTGMAFPPRRMREPPTPNYDMLQAPSLFSRSASQSRNASPVRGLESLANTSPVRNLENFANKLFAELGVPELGSPPRRQSTPQTQALSQVQPQSQSQPQQSLARPPNHDRKDGLSPSLFPIDTRAANLSPLAHGSAMTDSRRDSPVASQVAVFAAMDQTILARKVGAQSGFKDLMRLTGTVPKIEKDEDKSTDSEGKQSEHQADDEPAVKEPGAESAGQDTPSQTTSSKSSIRNSESARETEVTVSHILTNVVILQSFLFELAALVQVRAGLFNEVRFV